MIARVRLGVLARIALVCALAVGAGGCVRDAADTGADADGSLSATSATAAPGELTVAIAGMVTPEEGLRYYQDLSAYLARKAGLTVHLFHKAEYAEVNRMLEERRVDLAFVCSGPYVAGHDAFGLELLGAPKVGDAPVYYSYIIVPATSTVTSLEGLRGRSFAFTDPESNTGRIVPTYLVSKLGATPDTFFSRVVYTYSHDNSIKAVATGASDGAAVDSLIWDYANAHDPRYTSKTRIIIKSDPFGVPPVVVHPAMDPALKAQLRAALVGADEDPEGRAILEKMGIDEFVPIDDAAYDSIRAMNEFVEQMR